MWKILMISFVLLVDTAALFVLFVLYTVFIWSPVNIYTEAECLRNGYPEHRTSIGLERYCMTLDGSIIVRVDKITAQYIGD